MPADKAPIEKLPLAVRKNVRDEWDNKKADYEKQLSELLGTSWTIDINPNAVFAYAEDNSYGKNSLGACIAAYVKGAIWKLKYHLEKQGDVLKDEINAVAAAHTITLLASDNVSYAGADLTDGVLRLLFGPTYLGTNIDQSLDDLPKIISSAPQPSGAPSLSFAARYSVKSDYEANIGRVLEKARKLLENPELKFEPGFEEIGKKLKGNKGARDDWETNLGKFTLDYFSGFADKLEYEKFGDDDMLREGFAEAVPAGVVKFQIVEKMDGYADVKMEDDALVIYTTPEKWGTNIHYACEKLVDKL